jgi:hypothetical protein
VNRESIPLVCALLIPILLVGAILLYHYGYDVTLILRKIPILYYIVLFPIALGFIVGIAKVMRPD